MDYSCHAYRIVKPIPHGVAPQQSFVMLRIYTAMYVTFFNNHRKAILQFDLLKGALSNLSCNLTYTPNLLQIIFMIFHLKLTISFLLLMI